MENSGFIYFKVIRVPYTVESVKQEHFNIQGLPFEMSEKYNVIVIKLMYISLCNFL